MNAKRYEGKKMVSVPMPPEEYRDLVRIAQEEERTRVGVMRLALREYAARYKQEHSDA